MKFSRSLINTIKDYKKEGEEQGLRSQEYLTRGGFVLQVASGVYDFLPLGKMMLDNIQAIIKEELNNAGCLEVSLPFVTPSELWQKSGRFEKYGKELLRFKDRKDQDFVLSPTCEELMVDLAKAKVTSYRQLPLNLYQINLKFRDEIRPRFGLLRGREFMMKDGYSFHDSTEDMLREFHLMESTYKKIFERIGLEYKVVEADSGAIGGSGSKEFMVLANAGEDTLVVCKACEYGANIEAAKRKPKTYNNPPINISSVEVKTDGSGIEELCMEFRDYGLLASSCVKAIAKKAIYKDHSEPVIFFIAGNEFLEETKALNACNALAIEDLNEEDALKAGITLGFIGPIIGEYNSIKCQYYIDLELEGRKNLVMGANTQGYHLFDQSITAERHANKFKDLIAVQEGDDCPCCGAKMEYAKGIEVGHIFQLGDRYSAPMEARYLDKNGKTQNFIMGTYGIGVSRLISAIIEQHSDEKGCILPSSVAPYQVDVIISNVKDAAQSEAATKIYDELKALGIRVIMDDRDERYGFKMSDFELIGFPYAVVVGKNIAEGNVEIVDRKTLAKELVSAESIVSEIKKRFAK